ncbi:MAG: pyrroline-5-carboxylate reductase family protein [Litorimonas sp.]
MRSLMIGCGNMGSSLLRRWTDIDTADFTVIDPTSNFSHPKVRKLRDGDGLGDAMFDLIIVAVKPQLIDQIIPDYLAHLPANGTVVSIAAGYASERLQALTDGRPVIRIMPNMPASVGKGMSGVFATPSMSTKALDHVLTLMKATGDVIQVDNEDDLDRLTAVAGSGPGYVFEIARAYTQAAMDLGFDAATAKRLVLGTLSGAVEMALNTGDDLADLRNSVTSKAGTTEAGLNALNGDDGLTQRLQATTRAAYDRAVELR